MVDAPEKIWADNDGVWHSNDCSEVLPCTEYVRADIAEREKEELRTQSDRFCDKYLAALKRAETAERQLAERDAVQARKDAALRDLLAFAEALEKHSSKGSGGRRGGVIFAKARDALAGSGDGWRNPLEHIVEFVAKMAWRTDPPNANNKLSDTERLSAIKHHPTIKHYAQPHIELAEREAASPSTAGER